MTKEAILKKRWSKIDKKLTSYLTKFNKLTLIMKDELQAVLDSIDFTFEESIKPLSKEQKNKLIRLYAKWQEEGFMTTLFSYRARRAIAKKSTNNAEMLELIIESLLLKRDVKLDELTLLNEIATIAKDQAIEDVKEVSEEKPKELSWTTSILLALLLTKPNNLGYIWDDWKENDINYTAKQIKNQILIDLQQKRPLKVENYDNILIKEQKRYLNKKKDAKIDKFSGMLDNTVSRIVNSLTAQIYLDLGITKVRFIAILDEVTTDMCNSLDNQIFNVAERNEFIRYSYAERGMRRYDVIGLVEGINLPPITDSWHQCRSTIIPQIWTREKK